MATSVALTVAPEERSLGARDVISGLRLTRSLTLDTHALAMQRVQTIVNGAFIQAARGAWTSQP